MLEPVEHKPENELLNKNNFSNLFDFASDSVKNKIITEPRKNVVALKISKEKN